jgi:hypothetical protein
MEPRMKRTLPYVVAALFAVTSVNVFAAKHMAGEKGAKPTAEQCKADPKLKGCEEAKK